MRSRQPAHEGTTAHVQALFPGMAQAGLGARGVYVGRDVYSGGAFYYDPWRLYEAGVLSSTSMLVAGMIGSAKSSLVKTYLARQALFGRRALVVDPKGEYGSLAAWFDTAPLALRPGGDLRLNPLDPGAGHHAQLAVLAAVVSTALVRPLRAPEHTALDLALRSAGEAGVPTLPRVQRELLRPRPDAAREIASSAEEIASDGREAAHALRRLCEGDLQGMFDGATSRGVDLSGPVVVIDMSALAGSTALGVLMVCVRAWLEARMAAAPATKWLCVLDEAWAVLGNQATAEWLRESVKLGRARGTANIFVVHRISDLGAVGAAGSHQVAIAKGLLEDAQTRVILAQPPGELAHAREALGLSGAEASHLEELPRGVALWRVGRRAAIVQHRLSAAEWAMVDTDDRMREPMAGAPR